MPPSTFMSWVTRPRIYAYGVISTLAAVSTVGIAFTERSNFYAAVVFLGRSNGCLLVLLNFLLVIALVAGRILQLLYFGQLRRSEVELVCERSWYSLVGTLLAVSIFRDDFSVSFVILFGVLLFLKIFHWLSAERVASIMQSPSVPRIFHARMISILSTLLLADLLLVGFSLQMLLVKKIKIGMMVLFTSEFIILTALLCNTIAQYILNCIDMASEEPWEAKSLYVLYVDLAHDVVRLCTHGYFFVLLTRMYGIPLSLIHDLYSAGRSCTVKVKALVRYRQAVKKMETKYPNASAADLRATDGTCIICREDMVAIGEEQAAGEGDAGAGGPAPVAPVSGTSAPVVTNVTPKKLACGHIFHFRCLRSWLERQQSCPTCRRMILDDEPDSPAPPQQPPAQPPDQQQNDPAATAAGSNPTAQPSGAGADTRTPAEQTYDARLHGFLHRLQSDLRKVREEGNLSARHASGSSRQRRNASRSGNTTPRMSGRNEGTSFGSLSGGGKHAGVNGGSVGGEVVGVELGSGGGLWMPPPPSTLYAAGRGRPTQSSRARTAAPAENGDDVKGKGKARAESSAVDDDDGNTDEPTDPVDPREAIRQATLKRFGQLPSTTTTTSSSSSDPAASAEQPISMIPLFDPTSIPHFNAVHATSLPHPLATPSPSLPAHPSSSADTSAVDVSTVQSQITQLSAIQTHIDGLIVDLTRVLDAVSASGVDRLQKERPQEEMQNQQVDVNQRAPDDEADS
ncbi:ERAD-associated E3 ubiquitin-protein ligase HRD1 [Pseudozyma hubeiensis]|nr:ERAD-associated E3 ubiquitin-protein ligase HRD1 [Pseudozyma hubeiensis]